MTAVFQPRNRSKIGLILLAYIAFISLGLPDGLFGVAWPSIRINFSLPLDALGALLIGGTTGYLTSSFFSGRLMAWLGVGKLLAVSCTMTGLTLLGYTLAPYWWVMVALGVMGGLGAGAIDAGINTYVASNFGERWMQWLHASFGLGVTLGPLIMTTGLTVYGSWRWGYIVVGAAQLILASGFALTVSMWKQQRSNPGDTAPAQLMDYRTSLFDTLKQPAAWLSILLFFVYTGIELTLGHWAYTLLTESRGVAPQIAGLWAGSYWGMFMLGRVLAGVYANKVGNKALLLVSMLIALVGASLVWWNPAPLASLLGIAITGFAIAPIFPGLVSGTNGRVLPEHAANTIGMQISAAGLGGALMPGLAGVLAENISLETIPVFLTGSVLLLLVIFLLSIRGRK